MQEISSKSNSYQLRSLYQFGEFTAVHGGGNYKATAISQGTNLQLSNLHGFIKRGDVNKMWAHFLQGMHQSCNSGPGKMPNMQEKSDCQGTNQGLPSISQLNG